MYFYAVDLGTTNIKVGLYDEKLTLLALARDRVNYIRTQNRVEFDPQGYFKTILRLLCQCAALAGNPRIRQATIVLTGQAESFVLVDRHGDPLGNGISWMDGRGAEECDEIQGAFGRENGFQITGQPWVTTTWTATKLRWLRHNEPLRLSRAGKILLLKDYIQYCLTGNYAGERSIRGFTYFMDLKKGDYWPDMLDFCGVRRDQLPELIDPCADLGPVLPEVALLLPKCGEYRVNAGALDHFATLIGVGGYRKGVACESAGTVLSLTTLAGDKPDTDPGISCHIGPAPGSYVLFQCCDSGGVCLDWAMDRLPMSYRELEKRLPGVDISAAPVFLPFLTGSNPPEYYPNATGAFLGLTLAHGPEDLAYAVMEGVGCLLRSNVEDCRNQGIPIDRLISVGGGTRSPFWNQLKADLCGRTILVPKEREMTCRGAAVAAAVAAGLYGDYDEANRARPPAMKIFTPGDTTLPEERYRRYEAAKALLAPSFTTRKEAPASRASKGDNL